tara:strand:+ start:358 stop:540 length:183 start_codon:yes stop_codon:yes gene_type:complete
MIEFTKKDLLLILNTYQNYFNDFNNISEDDLTNIYIEIATEDMKKETTTTLINTYIKNLK